jgi:hypothetical protein
MALWKVLASVRTTVVLLCLVGVFLLLNVVVPQSAVVGDEALRQAASRGPAARLLIDTLGLGHIPTSPLFLAALGLFFLNLLVVLADRTAPTLRRIRVRAPAEAELLQLAENGPSIAGALPGGWDPTAAIETLKGYGFRCVRIGGQGLWGVKHRTAALGFLLFHASFLLLCAGGALLYYTRFAATARLVEGQAFTGEYQRILRTPPLGGPPGLSFQLVSVEPRFEQGAPVDLKASLLFFTSAGGSERSARVNHPARWGTASVLVEEAGVAPEIWLQDASGYGLDRVSVAAATQGGEPTRLALARGSLQVVLAPIAQGSEFPGRTALAALPIRLSVGESGRTLYDGSLAPGQSVAFGPYRLALVQNRYWAGFRVVSERGGALLIAGFALGVAGLVWRLLAFRRELFVAWGDGALRISGRGEFFQGAYRRELESILGTLSGRPASAGAGGGGAEEAP